MKTLKQLFGLSIAILLLGGVFTTSSAQFKKELQYYRPIDQNGAYMFTPTKNQEGYKFTGLKFYAGVGLTQQWQDLTENTSSSTSLTPIGPGFNLPTANLYLDAQLAEGMRLHLTTYLSSRHHTDTWVKGGYLRIDALPMLNIPAINDLMKYVSVKIGDMEINYGDAHFLRSDNANTIYNPLVGNYVLDSFTTMDGAEVYVFDKGFIGMVGLAGGQAGENYSVQNPDGRRPAIYGKLGFDTMVGNTRIRLTGSIFHDNRFQNLYNGDRSGARYYNVMYDATSAGDPFSGRVHPGFSNGFTSIMINPYIQAGGLHLFGIIETSSEMNTSHNVQQYAVNAQYFLTKSIYLAGRYDSVHGYLAAAGEGNGTPNSNETVNRVQVGAGWFLTQNVLAKVEYMSQNYKNFDGNSVFNGGKFSGLMVEAAIGF